MKYVLEGEESKRLLFRKLVEKDFDTWLEFFKDPSSVKYMWALNAADPVVNCRMWFDKVENRYANDLGGMNVLMDKTTGHFVGQCGLLVQTVDDCEELEIGYSLLPAFRNKGYASEAARKCRDFAFANKFRDSLISIIHEDNKESQRVAMANGMKMEKKSTYAGMPVDIFRITKEQHEAMQGR